MFSFFRGYPTLQPDLLKTNRGGQKQVYSCVYGKKWRFWLLNNPINSKECNNVIISLILPNPIFFLKQIRLKSWTLTGKKETLIKSYILCKI